MNTVDPKVMAQSSPAYWANLYKIQLQAGEFSFLRREYQIEPMNSRARRMCYMKATQLGITELEVLKTLHGLIYQRYLRGVLYLFPTTDNVHEFSKSRFNPLIAANRETIGQYVKAGGKGTDTTSLKKIHNAFLYLRGSRLSQGAAVGDKQSVQLASIPVDRVVFDELDLMDDESITKALGRMGDSEVKEEVYLSNPTIPGDRIDRLFQLGDQRRWHRRCGCGEWVCAELTFPDCVHVGSDGRGFIACPKCGADVGPRSPYTKGEWVPAARENTSYMESRQISQLNSANNDPGDILRDFQNPPNGDPTDVYRLRLGLPYIGAQDKLRSEVVYECCGAEMMRTAHEGPCAMGVDIGKVKHYLIGIRTGAERYELLRMGRLSDWNELHDLAKRFNVRSAVIDARPYEDEARRFQKAEPYAVWLAEYLENSVQDVSYIEASGLVKVNRTQICDRSHRVFTEGAIRLPRRCPEITEFVNQCCSIAKVLEQDKKSGAQIFRYRSMTSGGDHYRHALNYFLLAAASSKLARAGSSQRRSSTAIHEYQLT
jgi:hypothetical protein